MNLDRLLSFCVLVLVAAVCQAESANRLLPADEASRDDSLVQFRHQLHTSVKNRDPETFVQWVSEQVYSGPEKKKGMRNFIKFWQPQDTASELWPTMDRILNMGGGFVRSDKGVTFCAPYVFTNFPDDLDIYGHGAIVADAVPLKSAPLTNAQNNALLSYDLLKIEDWRSIEEKTDAETISWMKVSTLDGRQGYVNKQMVRSPTDYAACFLFTPKKGWQLVSLISNE